MTSVSRRSIRLSSVLFIVMLFGAFASSMAVENFPLTFGGNVKTDDSVWTSLVKYKLWGTGNEEVNVESYVVKGIFMKENSRIIDSLGYSGSANGGLTYHNINHTLGGPLLFNGAFKVFNGQDSILHGASHFKTFEVAKDGNWANKQNVINGKFCLDNQLNSMENMGVVSVRIDDEGQPVPGKPDYSCEGAETYDDSLDLPSVVENFIYDTTINSIKGSGTITIDVPPAPSPNTPYNIHVPGNIELDNEANFLVRMQMGGRSTRIIVDGKLKMSSQTNIQVVYADPKDEFNYSTGKWAGTTERIEDVNEAVLDYKGHLLFYLKGGWENEAMNAKDKYVIEGTYIVPTKYVIVKDHMNFAGQILGKNVYIDANFSSAFRFMPFEGASVQTWALGKLAEGQTDTKINFKLTKPASTNVSFDYCFVIAESYYKDVKPASVDDIENTENFPICGKKSGHVLFEQNETDAKPLTLIAKDDGVVEGWEYFFIKIYNLAGAVLSNPSVDNLYRVFIEDAADDKIIVGGNDTLYADPKKEIGLEDVEFKINSFPVHYSVNGEISPTEVKDDYSVIIQSAPKGSLSLNGEAIAKFPVTISRDDLADGKLTYKGLLNDYAYNNEDTYAATAQYRFDADPSASSDPAKGLYVYDSLLFKVKVKGKEPTDDVYKLFLEVMPVNDSVEIVHLDTVKYDPEEGGLIRTQWVTISEAVKLDSVIFYAAAQDTADSRRDADNTLKYKLEVADSLADTLDATKYLKIDSLTGKISVEKSFNYEEGVYYKALVVVTDNGVPGDREAVSSHKANLRIKLTKASPETEDFTIVSAVIDDKDYIGYEDIAFPINKFPAFRILASKGSKKDGSIDLIKTKVIFKNYTVRIESLPEGELRYKDSLVKIGDEISSDDLKNKSLTFKAPSQEFGDSSNKYIYTSFMFSILREGVQTPSAIKTVKLMVKPMNDNPEVKTQEFFTTEDISEGDVFGPVVAQDSVDSKRDSADKLTFKSEDVAELKKGEKNLWDYFTISESGEIKATKAIRFNKNDVYVGKVVVTDFGVPGDRSKENFLSDDANIYVKFQYEPQKPEFKVVKDSIVIEHSKAGTFAVGIKATDKNKDDILTITLDGNDADAAIFNKLFEFKTEGDSASIIVKADIDYETMQRVYTRTAIVTDNLNYSTRKEFRIYIKDINEAPFFVDGKNQKVEKYVFGVDFNKQVGTLVGTVFALDNDSAARPKTQLSFSMGDVYAADDAADEKLYNNLFKFDPATGKLSVAQSLANMENRYFKTKITVTDNGSKQNFCIASGVICAKGTELSKEIEAFINISSPQIPPKFEDREYKFSVKENSVSGTILEGVKKVVAKDENRGDALQFSIDPGVPFVIRGISGSPRTAELIVADKATIDFETTKEYSFKIYVWDGVFYDTAIVKVSVLDVNETPVIKGIPSEIKIAENTAKNAVVRSFKVSDVDTWTKNMTYAITDAKGNASSIFKIVAVKDNCEKGYFCANIVTTQAIDYETLVKNGNAVFNLLVVATDDGDDFDSGKKYGASLSGKASTIISITDVNEPPVFGKNEFSIPENTPAGRKVADLVAHDPEDSDDKLVYALLKSSNEFDVAKTGRITVKDGANLDYETTKEYTLLVSVTDTKGATTNGTAKIYITDVREPPILRDTILYVPENRPVGDSIGTLIPINPEKDKVKFTLLTNTGKFKIRENGVIETTGKLDYEKEKSYTLKVRLTGEDGSTSEANVTINVTNVIEIPKVKITRAESDGDIWTDPEVIYTNKHKFDFEWTVDGKIQPDTTVDFHKDGTYEFNLCYTDPTMDNPGCDKVIVKIDNSIPTVNISKKKEKLSEISGVTIVEPNPDKTKIFVNHEENDVIVEIKDKASGLDTSFNVTLKLNPLTNTKKALEGIKKISGTKITLDDAENIKRTNIGDKQYAVSFTKEVDGKTVTVSYIGDEKGKAVKNSDGDIIMKVSYETEIDGKPITVSYNVDGKTGDIVENANGGLYEISYSYDDDNGQVLVRYSVNEKGEFVKTAVGDLGYEVSYTYTNHYGNKATKTIDVVVDKIVPVVEIVSPAQVSAKNKIVVRTNGVDVKWTVDGIEQDTLVSQSLKAGLNKIIRTYRDKAGNEASDTVEVYLKGLKEIQIHVEKPVTIVDGDSVRKYYDDNPPKKGQSYAVSLFNMDTESEVETLIGGTFGKKKGSQKETYPGLKTHLGPTLLVKALAPRCGNKVSPGLCTLDDIIERDNLISLDAGGGRDRKKVTVDEYVEKYCSSEFRKEYKGDTKKASLYKTTLHVTIWMFTNLGGYLDHYSFTQEVNDPKFIDDKGDLNMSFELKPDLDGNVISSKGRLLGTGAYIFKTEVKSVSELRCKLPDAEIGDVHFASDALRKSFGYKRPVTKKK